MEAVNAIHLAAVADYIGRENGGEAALDAFFSHAGVNRPPRP
jgi:hypothetical protein